jgi:hypothetical protein
MRAFLRGLLGDPSDASLLPPVGSYEDLHNAAQSVLLPPTYAKGLSFHLLQPLTRHFAAQHRLSFAPRPQTEPSPMNPEPKFVPGERAYAVGAVSTHALDSGGKWRLAGTVDVEKLSLRGTLLGDVWGEGRLRVLAQGAAGPVEPPPAAHSARSGARATRPRWEGEWAGTATLRGADYVAVARLKHGPELGASYCQRLAPGSPVTLGGELVLSVPELSAAAGGGGSASGARRPRPLELALGAAYDAADSRTSAHYAATSSFSSGVLSLQHLLRVTERSHLAAKLITDCAVTQSMVAVGYRMHFRNTRTTLHGMADSYGSIRQVRGGGGGCLAPPGAARRPAGPTPAPCATALTAHATRAHATLFLPAQVLETEPMKDLKVGLSICTSVSKHTEVGFKATLGAVPQFQAPLSPVTMTRDIFSLAP